MPDLITVVNMIPSSLSGETNQDSEPNLAVNPANLQEIAGTAFTPSPGGSPTRSPIFGRWATASTPCSVLAPTILRTR